MSLMSMTMLDGDGDLDFLDDIKARALNQEPPNPIDDYIALVNAGKSNYIPKTLKEDLENEDIPLTIFRIREDEGFRDSNGELPLDATPRWLLDLSFDTKLAENAGIRLPSRVWDGIGTLAFSKGYRSRDSFIENALEELPIMVLLRRRNAFFYIEEVE